LDKHAFNVSVDILYHTNAKSSLHRAHSLQVKRGQGTKDKASGLRNLGQGQTCLRPRPQFGVTVASLGISLGLERSFVYSTSLILTHRCLFFVCTSYPTVLICLNICTAIIPDKKLRA